MDDEIIVCPHCGEEITPEDIVAEAERQRFEEAFESSSYAPQLKRIHHTERILFFGSIGVFITSLATGVYLVVTNESLSTTQGVIVDTLLYLAGLGFLGVITSGFFLGVLWRRRLRKQFSRNYTPASA